MTQAVQKNCNLCGLDLNGQKRVKSETGEYFCPSCWKTHAAIFGESAAVATLPPALQAVSPPPLKKQSSSVTPTVRIVRSELEPTVKEAAIQGVKEGAIDLIFNVSRRIFIFFQLIAVLVVAKKFFPDMNSGTMGILALTSAIAAVLEFDCVARLIDDDYVWIDLDTIKSRAGILGIIGLGLAYLLAIFLAVNGK